MPTVLLTRPAEQVAPLRAAFAAAGWDVVCQAAIVIRPPASWSHVDEAIETHDAFDWILFSSASGVIGFGERWQSVSPETFPPPQLLGCVGRETAKTVETVWRQCADLYPAASTAAALATALESEAQQRKRFLSVRGSRGSDTLASGLVASGGFVTEIAVYESIDVAPHEVDPRVDAMMHAKQIDAITVTSSAIARSLVRIWGDALHATRLIAIGPVTASTLVELGFPASAVAHTADIAGLVAAAQRRPSGPILL